MFYIRKIRNHSKTEAVLKGNPWRVLFLKIG
jgi:hypothetical protein